MDGQVKIIEPEKVSDKIIKVANDIKQVTEMVRNATSNLRLSYLYGTKRSDFKDLHTEVFNNAIIYKNKVIPFTKITIICIKDFCNIIKKHKYNDFKKNIIMIIDNVKKSEKSCEFTYLFYYYILVEFKKVQNKILNLELKQDLNNKTEKKTNESMLPGFTSLA